MCLALFFLRWYHEGMVVVAVAVVLVFVMVAVVVVGVVSAVAVATATGVVISGSSNTRPVLYSLLGVSF